MLELSQILANFGQAVLGIGAVVGGGFALWQHRRSIRTGETELLFRLFQSFYQTDRYRRVRHTIDLLTEVTAGHDPEILLLGPLPDRPYEEEFVDYLNFFEFVFGLLKTGRLRRSDVDAAFDWYIRALFEVTFIRQYIASYGFEALLAERDRRWNTPPARRREA
jgi:hypothetical protein